METPVFLLLVGLTSLGLLVVVVVALAVIVRRRPPPGIWRQVQIYPDCVHATRPLPPIGEPIWCRKRLARVRLCVGCPHYQSTRTVPPVRAGRQ
jgi:hypothetical protein